MRFGAGAPPLLLDEPLDPEPLDPEPLELAPLEPELVEPPEDEPPLLYRSTTDCRHRSFRRWCHPSSDATSRVGRPPLSPQARLRAT